MNDNLSKRTLIILIVAFSSIFIASAVIFNIFEIDILPSQFFGALIGVVITAIITVLLLQRQTSNEEAKEKNVRVFEEKTIRYNRFIDELWKIWDDRLVSLEELNEIMKLFCKDIIMFTNSNNSKKIIDSLNNIAAKVNKNVLISDAHNDEDSAFIQEQILDIINILSKELNQGGNVSHEIRTGLLDLEKKILPFIKEKERKIKEEKLINESKEKLFKGLKDQLEEPFVNVDFKDWVDGEYIFIDIENIPIKVIAGPVTKTNNNSQTIIGLYYDYYKYPQYRYLASGSRGWSKEILKGYWLPAGIEIVDFNDITSVSKFFENKEGSKTTENLAEKLVSKLNEFFKQWKYEGKNLYEVLEQNKSL